MAKTTKPKSIVPKKEVEKTVIEKVKTAVTGKGSYHLYIKVNDREFETDTDNLFEAIMSFKPAILKTALTIRVTRGGKTYDKYFYLRQGRQLFVNQIMLEAFVRNITL